MKNKKLIIFDFDGTLVDSMETFADIAAKVINQIYGTPIGIGRELYIKTSGLPFCQQIESIFPENKDNNKAVNVFEKEKLEGYFNQPVYNDVHSTLEFLKKNKKFTAISSNDFQHLIEDYVKKNNLKLDFMLGYKTDDYCKGASHFRDLQSRTKCSKEEMLFVGDSLKDAERAIEYGIDFIGKTGLFTKADFLNNCGHIQVINNLDELCNKF